MSISGLFKVTLPNCARKGYIPPGRRKEDDVDVNNPWLPPVSIGSKDIFIAGLTPAGTIAKVPTTEVRPIKTYRLTRSASTPQLKRSYETPNAKIPMTQVKKVMLRIVPKSTPKINPIFKASIYLKTNKAYEGNIIANKMQSIAEYNNSMKYKTEFKELIDISGIVSPEIYEEALTIYENNQVYYQDCLTRKDNVIKAINELELWFIQIIEPKPQHAVDILDWKDREITKLKEGHTAHCDPELIKYLNPLPFEYKRYLEDIQRKIF